MLRSKQIEEIVGWGDFGALPTDKTSRSRVARGLTRLLSREGEALAWRAAEAMGEWTARVAREDDAFALEVLRRLRWSLLDEAGATPWMSAEAIVEIAVRNAALGETFVPVVLSHYDDMAPRGAIWAAGRLGADHPDWFKDFAPTLIEALARSEVALRGHAVWALGQLGRVDDVRELKNDDGAFRIYREGDLVDTTVASEAARAIENTTD